MYTERVGVTLQYPTILDSRLCRSILLPSGVEMVLLGNHFKVFATLAFYSKQNSSMRPAVVQSLSSPHHGSVPSISPHTFSMPDTLAFSQCLLPCSLLLHGKAFPDHHTTYFCSVSVSSWKSSLHDCVMSIMVGPHIIMLFTVRYQFCTYVLFNCLSTPLFWELHKGRGRVESCSLFCLQCLGTCSNIQ